jgi:hypothetical protein
MSETALPSLPLEPVVLGPRFCYESICDRIVAGGGAWVRIFPDEIHGQHNAAKQSLLLQAGRLRGLKFNTTFRVAGWICARLVITQDAAVAR